MAQVMVIANAMLALVYAFNSPTYKSMVREVIEKERIGFYLVGGGIVVLAVIARGILLRYPSK